MKKIAIIEDDSAIAQMYRIKFEAEGYKVQTAENGQLGLELIHEFQPDIVLLDLMMPTMSGHEMLEILRQEESGKNVKVIVLTNMGESEIPPQMRELGVEAIILKASMTPRQVAALVEEHLQ